MSATDLKSVYKKDLTENFPDELTITLGGTTLRYEKRLFNLPGSDGRVVQSGLRYGENPDQPAALYRLVNGNLSIAGVEYVGPGGGLVSSAGSDDENVLFGCRKHPSKTNLTDVDSALGIVRYLDDDPAAVIVKHNNPSGAAQADSLDKAFHLAFEADRVAAFGGALVVNKPLDKTTALMMTERYMEVVAAPDYEEGVAAVLAKKPDLRVLRVPGIEKLSEYRHRHFLDVKSLLDGGLVLQQSALSKILKPGDFQKAWAMVDGQKIESVREPTASEIRDLLFGWAVEQGVVSNSVVFVKNRVTVGIGCGQQDRVGVVRIAVFKARRNYAEHLSVLTYGLGFADLRGRAEEGSKPREAVDDIRRQVDEARGNLMGSSMVSDAFFPFRDAPDAAIAQGATALAHPGGSLRDAESLLAANEAGAAMVHTGQRAFKH
ncbi:MAG: IMP cyclohydrolase [Deltaproteobacteria bacterium]|jgi:phosphoribosylaminoimidazolecarboxamide formyltransferase/IMP cyclohydrolase|nr:IMP cyclohydrolase [Deltaproteobacteria bacterium]